MGFQHRDSGETAGCARAVVDHGVIRRYNTGSFRNTVVEMTLNLLGELRLRSSEVFPDPEHRNLALFLQ